MSDIAQLGLAIDSSSANVAASALDRMKTAASGATDAAARLKASSSASAQGIAAVSRALNESAASLTLTRMQMLELTHVGRSMFDMLAAGQSPLRALQMEGARIAQVFAEGPGGVGGTLKAMGATVARLSTGWLGLGAAVAAGAGVAGAAVLRFQRQQDALAFSLNGAGRYAGVSLAGLSGMANAAGARSPMLGQGGATEIAAMLARTGRISGGMIPGILDATAPYARATGQDVSTAGEQLAKAFAEPVRGAEELSQKLGFLDARNRELIQSMRDSGNVLGAQRLLLDEVAEAARQAADRTWGWQRAWDKIKSEVGAGMDKFGAGVSSAVFPSLRQQRAAYQSDLDRQNMFGGFFRNDAAAEADRREIAKIDAELRRLEDVAKQAGAEQASKRLSLQAGDALDAISPVYARMRRADSDIELLKRALGDPAAAGLVPGGSPALSDALERAQNQRANMSPLQRIGQDSALSVAAIQALTGAERTLAEARRAELETLRNAGTTAEAAAKSLAVLNDAIAQTNKTGVDALRSARERASLAGLKPYQRGRREIELEFERMNRDAVTGPLSALTPDDMRMTALDDSRSTLAKAMLSRARLPIDLDLAAASEMPVKFPKTTSGGIGSDFVAARRLAPSGIAIPSTYARNTSQAKRIALAAYDKQEISYPLLEAQESIDAQSRLLETQKATWGKMPDAIAAAMKKTELYNDEVARGIPITKEVLTANERIAKAAGELRKRQEEFQRFQDMQSGFNDFGRSFVGGAANDVFSTFNTDPRNLIGNLSSSDQAKYFAGQLSGGQVRSMVAKRQITDLFRQMMFQQGVGMIQRGLFGSGKDDNGLIGGLFNSALGGVTGIATGMKNLDSLFNGWGSFFAGGGVMTSAGPMPLRRYEGGGVANSPQLAMFGEGSKPEAYVPLPDGRRIPVAMQGGGGHTFNTTGPTIIVQGNADDKAIAAMKAEVMSAMAAQTRDMQRNFVSVQNRANTRYNPGV